MAKLYWNPKNIKFYLAKDTKYDFLKTMES